MATNWTIRRTSSPQAIPVTLQEIKSHLRLNENDPTHDENLSLLLQAATERLEQDIDRQLITSTYTQSQSRFYGINEDRYYGDDSQVILHAKSVSAVNSLSYIDRDGVTIAMQSSDYVFDISRGSLFPLPGELWPETQFDNASAVTINFTAGYGSDADCMPRLFKTAIMLGVGKWFYDPAQEGSALHSQEIAYEKIVTLLMRSSYP